MKLTLGFGPSGGDDGVWNVLSPKRIEGALSERDDSD